MGNQFYSIDYIKGKYTLLLRVSAHLRFDVQLQKIPYKVSDVNKKAYPFILDGNQVMCEAHDTF